MKKVFRVLIWFVIGLFIALLLVPFLFKGQIQEAIKTEINKQVNAEVQFEDISLSVLKNFPSLSIDIQGDRCDRRGVLRSGNAFQAEILEVNGTAELAISNVPVAVVVLRGSAELDAGGDDVYHLESGSAWVLPADLARATIQGPSGELQLLVARPVS